MIAVNLFGPPGAGKTTTAEFVASYMKNRYYYMQLVTEYAKDMVYSKRNHEMSNQIYLLAKQYKRMKDLDLYKSVPILITDSPIRLCAVYARGLPYEKELLAMIPALESEFTNVNVLVKRVKPYNPSGRNQTEEESDALGVEIGKLLPEFDFVINGDEDGQIELGKALIEKYGTVK
jgi:hypothetical protein